MTTLDVIGFDTLIRDLRHTLASRSRAKKGSKALAALWTHPAKAARRLLVIVAVTVALVWATHEKAEAANCRHPKIARTIDRYLAKVGSPAAGQGCVIAEESIRQGWNPAFVTAVAGTESSFWVAACSNNPKNGWGLSSCGPGWYVPYFDSWREAIRFYARFLNRWPRATSPYHFYGYAACDECWGSKTSQHMYAIVGHNNVRWRW